VVDDGRLRVPVSPCGQTQCHGHPISLPFEVRIPRFDEDDVDMGVSVEREIEQTLLSVVRNCFDRDPDIAPETVDERFGDIVERDGKYSKRVVFAVLQMFGVEFAPEVVLADGSVRNLTWRICNAKKALVSVESRS
jgi:phosphatidylethanolamine N-methyltransferase